jgi:DNA-binding transcriptional MocR family regulator
MFSASRQFGNFLRVNYGHPLSAKALAAVKQVGRLLGSASHRGRS